MPGFRVTSVRFRSSIEVRSSRLRIFNKCNAGSAVVLFGICAFPTFFFSLLLFTYATRAGRTRPVFRLLIFSSWIPVKLQSPAFLYAARGQCVKLLLNKTKQPLSQKQLPIQVNKQTRFPKRQEKPTRLLEFDEAAASFSSLTETGSGSRSTPIQHLWTRIQI